ncbi:MAG: BLUF domain-containing protein [Paracoccus sp. (in: a-proteobacteria)]|nr:BLUF domain-containing protein [Paracoccus sp. (in: a-proteobacteria)]
MTLSYFLYRSYGRLDHFAEDCDIILPLARARNRELDLSGFLHCEDGVFVQWLEGPKPALEQVVESILADHRHRDVTVFGNGPLEERQFPNWAMGYSVGRQAPLFEYLTEQEAHSRDARGFGHALHQFLLLRAA